MSGAQCDHLVLFTTTPKGASVRSVSTDREMASRGGQSSRSSMALASPVLLLGAGYVLLVAAPLVLQRLPLPGRTWDGAGNGSWFPAAAASGLAIGGAAALIYVLGRLVREVENQPYACLAPVLGVFSAFVLAGLHVKLPIPNLLSEHFGVLAMAVAVIGGALVQQRGVLSGLTGAFMTVLPTAVLFTILWLGSGQGDLRATVGAMESQVRVFTVLMSVSSLAMLAIALVARAIVHAPRAQPTQADHTLHVEDDELVWDNLRMRADQTPRMPMLGIPDNESYLPWNDEFPAPQSKGTPRWLIALLVLAALGTAGAFGYRLYEQHQKDSATAALALRAEQERKAKDQAAIAAAAAQKNAEQAKAAEERLNAMLNAPPQAAAAPAAAQVAPEAAVAAEPSAAVAPTPEPEKAVAAAAPGLVAEAEAEADEESDAAAAERREKRASRRMNKRVKQLKAERAERQKVRAERESNEDAQRSVSKTLNPSNDPILGLLEE
jgi:hypothetical protein